MIDKALQEMLLSVQAETKTGRVVVLGREGMNSRICSLGVFEGEIVNAIYQKLHDNSAISAILELEIQQVTFLGVHDVAASGFPGLYSIDDIIQLDTAAERKQSTAIDLQAKVISLVKQLIDPSAEQMIETIAKNTSPVEQPTEFLDRCREYAEMMVGKSKAKSSFSPLYTDNAITPPPALNSAPVAALDLKSEVVTILTTLINPGAAQMVETIAANTSPVNQPREFIDHCYDYASMIVGKRKAKQSFAELYAKVK